MSSEPVRQTGWPGDCGGEELFLVERVGDATYAEVRAVSRPGRWYVAAGGPVVRLMQRWFARRYLAALKRAVNEH